MLKGYFYCSNHIVTVTGYPYSYVCQFQQLISYFEDKLIFFMKIIVVCNFKHKTFKSRERFCKPGQGQNAVSGGIGCQNFDYSGSWGLIFYENNLFLSAFLSPINLNQFLNIAFLAIFNIKPLLSSSRSVSLLYFNVVYPYCLGHKKQLAFPLSLIAKSVFCEHGHRNRAPVDPIVHSAGKRDYLAGCPIRVMSACRRRWLTSVVFYEPMIP